ncbi:MAG TPA: Na+/H+ antiporter NhaA, partial [Longimicrobiales bacterium]|nr:Na+/H+ antiporter NhaA [Longimicrobiales bacterium]
LAARATDEAMTRSHESLAPPDAPGPPPGSWPPARRLALRAFAPVERFLAIEAASGIVLLVCAAVALAWANSPWRDSYYALWHVPLGLRLGPFAFERDLHFWINDGVMTIFFFVVGLEIRREIHRGELSELRRAALPLAAAVGGMLVPALLYITFNWGRESMAGWGIPMATDIAFAVGVLTLLGSRVPPALRILLLALAVIDDVGAILVIALFYSANISLFGFLIAGAGVGTILLMQMVGVRKPWAYVPAGAVVWAGAYAGGIHPTLAGVAIGLMTPVRPWFGPIPFIERAVRSVALLRQQDHDDDHAVLAQLESLDEARREAVAPVERIERALHGWVAFGVMPLFALANAGVSLGDAALAGEPLLVFLGISIGLVLGKPLGILGFSWLTTRLGLAVLPRGIGWRHIAMVGVVAGIGFTMSIFIAGLAFQAGTIIETAKIGVLVGSGVAALLGYGLGLIILRVHAEPGSAATEAEAEASTLV